ncbi:hypothetical protein AWC38_SpisGene22695 [Stylophora pistillata]|uniref:MULE transposase domain-containing protein n=1 Tax=Stylophora pistillata TaxID=50429 RepID=A0A2B4RAI2_STYPI|nr:hypothetical protein AWC38_SpisGene22695 [Stylophora pistillata]
MQVLSEADIPRGRTQAYDMKRDRSKATCSQPRRKQIYEMASFNWYAKTERKGFVRMHELSSKPLILLATDKQLADLSRFCRNNLDFSYLSVDPAFNFGEFSITPTSYRNIFLKSRRSNKCPVFVGPIFIHHSKTKDVYAQFFPKLKCLAPQLEQLLVFGADGESALSDALSDSFPGATHLRCFLHFRKNIETKLVTHGVKDHKQYIEEIFGKQEGATYEMGLLDTTSEDMFDAVLASLQEPCARREQKECGTSSFHNWMLHRAQMMEEFMNASVRTKAGLGYPPDKFYTNDSENTNRLLRHKRGERELENQGVLSEFVAWYRKQKFPTSLTSVASLGINAKASGSKQGTAKRQRNSKDDVLQYNSSLVESIENGGNQVETRWKTTQQLPLVCFQAISGGLYKEEI